MPVFKQSCPPKPFLMTNGARHCELTGKSHTRQRSEDGHLDTDAAGQRASLGGTCGPHPLLATKLALEPSGCCGRAAEQLLPLLQPLAIDAVSPAAFGLRGGKVPRCFVKDKTRI